MIVATQKHSDVKELWSNKFFMASMLLLTSLYFIVTGIQFWISDYLREIMMVPPEEIYAVYAAIQITAPTAGVIIGGVGTAYLYEGGYENPKSINFCLVIGIIAMIVAIPCAYVRNVAAFFTLLWLLLCCGGALLPPVMGSMISSIP